MAEVSRYRLILEDVRGQFSLIATYDDATLAILSILLECSGEARELWLTDYRREIRRTVSPGVVTLNVRNRNWTMIPSGELGEVTFPINIAVS